MEFVIWCKVTAERLLNHAKVISSQIHYDLKVRYLNFVSALLICFPDR